MEHFILAMWREVLAICFVALCVVGEAAVDQQAPERYSVKFETSKGPFTVGAARPAHATPHFTFLTSLN